MMNRVVLPKRESPALLNQLVKGSFLFLLWALMASQFGRWHGVFDLFTPFQLQYLIGSLVFAFWFGCWRAWRWAGVALLGVVMSGSAVAQFYWPVGYAHSVKDGRRLRLLHYNVLYHNRRYDDVTRMIRAAQPELVFLQEFTKEWEQGTAALLADFPYTKIDARGDVGGVAVFSRLPLTRTELAEVGNYLSPSLRVDVALAGGSVSILTGHPPTPLGDAFYWRNQQLRQMADYAAQLPQPRVVIGDLNIAMWSPFFQDLLDRAGLRDVREGFGLWPTWPADNPTPFLRIPIDHCLVSRDVRVVAVRTGPDVGSDHLPLIVDLAIQAGE